MSMGNGGPAGSDHDHPHQHDHDHDGDEMDGEIEEINVDITEDGMVWLHGSDFELVLTPLESRELGQALIDAAADAEAPEE